MSPEPTFRQFCKLPVSIQRRIWSFALPQGPSIIEVAYTDNQERLHFNPEGADRFLCTSPYESVLTVCGQINYPQLGIRPVHISKLGPEGSRARPQSETMYLRPEIDILYFPDLITLDAAQFGANADRQSGQR
jgi:hypothetical protein